MAVGPIDLYCCEVYWLGGVTSGALTANRLFHVNNGDGRGGCLEVRNVNMTSLVSGDAIINFTSSDQWNILVSNCQLGSAAGLMTVSSTASFWSTAKFYNVNNVITGAVQFLEKNGFGSAESEASIYFGASDGTINYSAKLISTALVQPYFQSFRYQLGVVWVDGSGDKTITVEIARDGTAVALQDDEIWLEAAWHDDTVATGHMDDDRMATILTTPADQASSTAAWIGLGGTNSKQKLEVTITDRQPGPVTVWVHLAKPSTTVYVDPKIVVS